MKWYYSRDDFPDWKMEMVSDPQRIGRSFLLDIAYSDSSPMPPMHVANCIGLLYGRSNVREIHFVSITLAMVVLEDPRIYDNAFLKLKSCIFTHNYTEKCKKVKIHKKVHIRMNVHSIFPVTALAEFLVKDALEILPYADKDDPFKIMILLLQMYHPNLGSFKVMADWPGKDKDSKDLRISFICSNIEYCRKYFLRKERVLYMYGRNFKVLFIGAFPMFKREATFPENKLQDLQCIPW